jgi:hypothetical protein
MGADFGTLGRLRLHGPVRAEEDERVDRNQSEGYDRPAAAFHVFMAQRDEHGQAPSVEIEVKRLNFLSLGNEAIRGNCPRVQCRLTGNLAIACVWWRGKCCDGGPG